MRLRNIVSAEIVKASAGGTFDDLESIIVEPGPAHEIRHVPGKNKPPPYPRLTIGVADGLSFIEKEEENSPAAGSIYWTRSKFIVPAGKKLRARLTGCTSGDDLH